MGLGDQDALIQMMDLVQCKGKTASCYHMHQELIPSHGEKRRHLYVEMDGPVFQLTSRFGPARFGQCVDCQTVLQKQHVSNYLYKFKFII